MGRLLMICLALTLGAAAPTASWAQMRWYDTLANFATLPAGVRYPEGISANPANGDVYVATFDYFGTNPNKLLRYDRNGKLLGSRDFNGTPMLGLAFGPADGKVYIANFGLSTVQRVNADLGGPVKNVASIPGVGAPGDRTVPNPDGSSDTIKFGSSNFPAPNAMTFDSHGNLYVSDSFQGAIWRIADAQNCSPCAAALFVQDPLLATAGFPPFGANGLALSGDEKTLFVANTGDDRVLKVDMTSTAVSVFAESINGADGIAFDDRGMLWVAANQADEIVGLNDKGRVVAKIGSFDRIGADGAPVGLLFPASIVFVGREMYVTNLALPLTDVVGDEPEEDVTRWTVSRIRLLPNR